MSVVTNTFILLSNVNLFSKISLENWITQCELERPGCKSKWIATIQPVLQKNLD